jgi:penicillin amidase
MRKWIRIIILIVIGASIVLAGAGVLWYKRNVKNRLARTAGEVTVSGLSKDVEIIRDAYGVPHIYAKNESDLYFAFGYAMAQDRFWQMEFYRRLGQGRLAEIFGGELVEVDRYFRMLTAGGVNRDVPPEFVFALESFTRGVNAYVETHEDRLPVEFKLLGHRPEPWRVDDYLHIVKVANWGLSSGWHVDLTAARILEKVGEEKLREAFPVWPGDAPLEIPQESPSFAGLSHATTEVHDLVRRMIGIPRPWASNNWVVSGKKSATGKPILANDPHLELTTPSLFWEVHLVCPTLNVSGVALAGIPGISVGHNQDVAWGITNVMLDDVDFYVERLNPENPQQYWYIDHWEEMRVVEEAIEVKGGDTVKTEIFLIRHGPVVERFEKGSEKKAISARWSFTELPQPARATYLLAKARNIDDVTEALKSWTIPGQNFVFADTRGNTGYWCAAAIPIRSKGDGLLPVPGWTGEYEWEGFVPAGERPHLINPEAGFIATANNKPVGRDYPYLIGHYWEPLDRISRIQQMLEAKKRLSLDDVVEMQQDVYSVSASEMTPSLLAVIKSRLNGPEAQAAGDILAEWDFMMDKESVGACLFEVTYQKTMENTFKDELGDALFQAYLETGSFPPRAMRRLFRKGGSPWFDDVHTPETETMEDILAKSLTETLAELKEALGNDMSTWRWGRIHRLTFKHVLAKKKPLDWLLNLGPFPIGGSNLTVNVGRYPYENPYDVNVGASLRMIVDLSDVDGSLRVLPTGESGQPGSRHYQDQVDLYLEGRYHPDRTDRGDIEKNAEAVLILKPES